MYILISTNVLTREIFTWFKILEVQNIPPTSITQFPSPVATSNQQIVYLSGDNVYMHKRVI